MAREQGVMPPIFSKSSDFGNFHVLSENLDFSFSNSILLMCEMFSIAVKDNY